MRYYTKQHKFYCGIDLHAKQMYVCVIDDAGTILLHRNIESAGAPLLELLAPYREDVVVAVECIFTWYWLADLCAREKIPFVLGHALYMKAIHGGKSKNDKIDSEKIARLLKAGMLPQGHVYPAAMRGIRDLARRRLFFVRKRAELLAHVQMTYQQHNHKEPGNKLKNHNYREALEKPFDAATTIAVEADLATIGHYTTLIGNLERKVEQLVRKQPINQLQLSLLQTIPGIGPVLSTTILCEVEDIARFPTVQKFCSYARLIKPTHMSAGKTLGGGCRKIGNPHLRWAFAEAVLVFLRDSELAKGYFKRLQRKFSKGKSMSILSHRIAKAAYFILQNKKPWDEAKFRAAA